MKAYIFLNGFYDFRYIDFYKSEIELADDTVLICADGGIKIFNEINAQVNTNFYPDILLGDEDSVEFDCFTDCDVKIIKKTGQDRTDGEFAVTYAIKKCNCSSLFIWGGLNDARDYNTDHFLGNLKLMRFGFNLYKKDNPNSSHYHAVMRDVFQDIHFVVDSLTVERKGEDVERVSLWTDYSNTTVKSSQNLKWALKNFYIDPNTPNAMRNEFVQGFQTAFIILQENSEPVYLIHNW